MSCLDPFKIDLRAFPEGVTTLNLTEDDAYFTALEGSEVRGGYLRTVVTVNRLSDLFELTLHTEGTVTVACDLCLDDMDQPIAVDDRVVARLGEALSEEDDVIAVEEEEGILDLAWIVYQSIYLGIPLRHVHAPGKCNPAMTKLLQEHSAVRSGDGDNEEHTDSRWDALKNIQLDN